MEIVQKQTHEVFWEELDELGEDDVRLKFAIGWWKNPLENSLVGLWLSNKAEERALSATNKAARDSTRAIMLSIISIIIAFISLMVATFNP
jgi:hypothetical protein